MQYVTVFDVGRDGFEAWWFPASGLLFVATGIAVLVGLRKRTGAKARLRRMFMVVWTGFAVVWTIGVFSGKYGEYIEVRNALASNAFVTVEGVVSNFKPQSAEGHADEQFDVSEHHFAFSEYVVSAGYHRPRVKGGAVRDGLRVRIADVDGQIARLDTAISASTPPPNGR